MVGSVPFIRPSPTARDILVVARHRHEGFVRHALIDIFAADVSDDGVAALDVVVEKVQRLAGIVSLEPERELAEFNRQRVRSTPYMQFELRRAARRGMPRRRLLLASSDNSKFRGDAPGGGKQDMS